ncbi:MAG: exosome complex protein Rrp42 [Candidatus Altiarchaeota archaeon]|nr:exosome complex protein Rrp42 [Candidatus Altiarchaeota archaeon]
MNIDSYLKKDYITNLLETEEKRISGRELEEVRPLTIIKGYVADKACGSAYVKLGDTEVLAGITMTVGEPYPDSPTSGVMSTSVEFRPIAHPAFESGPPREDAIEVARVIDRGIRESKCIDFDKLYIQEDKVWMVNIDIHILNHSGNLIDAGGYAAIAALLNTQVPKFDGTKIVRGEWDRKLEIECTPVPFTFSKIGSKIILDTDMDEEYAQDARLTVTTTDTLNAMQKGGVGAFKPDEVKALVKKAFEMSGTIRSQLEA